MMVFNGSGALVGVVHETGSGTHAHAPGGRGEPMETVADGTGINWDFAVEKAPSDEPANSKFPFPDGVSHQRFANAFGRGHGGGVYVPVEVIDSVLEALVRRRAEMVRVANGGAR